MRSTFGRRRAAPAAAFSILLASTTAVVALQQQAAPGRFTALTVDDPAAAVDVATTPVSALPQADALRSGWGQFRAIQGESWSVHLDRRSGAPLLVEGPGIPWSVGKDASVASLGGSLRAFIAGNRALLHADDAELVLDDDASGALLPEVWQIVFKRVVSGIPVAGERYLFTIGHGNLISFGAPRWSRIDASPIPALDAADVQELLFSYMKLGADDVVDVVEKPQLQFIPLRAAGAQALAATGPYVGTPGAGYASALVWRVALRVAGDPGTWVALVDAQSGRIRSFRDDTKYARVKGGVYPISGDQICPDGCEQPSYPMPFANISIGAAAQTTTTLGTFNCTPSASSASTTLAGPYVRVVDNCGPLQQTVTCNADIDLFSSAGTDCTVPAGASAGNTHAARSSFYHLNRIAEHARVWLPTRTWLTNQLPDRVNLSQVCNAYWDGIGVNFFKSGSGCNNTGEIAGVFLHEWGHGLDQNDGGGFDNPSEAYGDITAFMSTHVSCIGRGFRQFGTCGGYGNHCLTCTGVRDQDWDQRAEHTPSTPAGFLATHCLPGTGPCGKEEHCEGYVGGETLWDLAVRDLPASGLDAASAWQLADKLWYKSRLGSGGDAYNCSLPNSDGCSAGTWFAKLRAIDDDDGNLANGTPHAAAIFAAFNRHGIACGTADDPGNQNSTTCPAIGAATLTASAGSSTSTLTWTPVANSIGFRIMRNDAGCQAATTRLSIATGTTFSDTALVNGYPLYYSVQAIGANSACDGPLSNCVAVTPQPAAGSVKLDATVYPCAGQVAITVTDSNLNAASTTATLASTTEPQVEAITLTRVAPGSASYTGSITLTGETATHDGVLSVTNGDTITARYIDANDGAGHANQQRMATALASCPVVSAVAKPVADGSFGTAMTGSRTDPAGSTIDVTWDVTTCASSDHHLLYGDLAAVASAAVAGGVCDLGTAGSATWSGVPSGDLWFVVVGNDDATTEGSWGTDGTGAERGGGTASGLCGLVTRNNSGACP